MHSSVGAWERRKESTMSRCSHFELRTETEHSTILTPTSERHDTSTPFELGSGDPTYKQAQHYRSLVASREGTPVQKGWATRDTTPINRPTVQQKTTDSSPHRTALRTAIMKRSLVGLLAIGGCSVKHVTGFSSESNSNRREAIGKIGRLSTGIIPLVARSPPATANSQDVTPLSTKWTSVDGLNSLESEKFVSFDKNSYQAMVNDQSRTPLFEKAITNRLKSAEPDSQVVLDLGTGPFALFAVMAAEAGAKHVYAIEASADAAASARDVIRKKKLEDKVTILEGFSTDVTLPEKADFAVAEIVGSVATEESAVATILDASRRLVKDPADPRSWIPSRVQTLGAPASYTLHNLFRPPAFDWDKLDGQPVRFNCRDEGLQLLSDPAVVEDVSFADIARAGAGGTRQITFTVDPGRVEENVEKFGNEFAKNGQQRLASEVGRLKVETANSVSGIAMWPRLILDDDIEINSRRYPDGGQQKSHWQTVLPILSPEPVPVKGGDRIVVNFDFDIPKEVTRPASYKISGQVVST
ncbi:hypothetical protein THAOC_33308 [Thalassiosira oceanica]|uniref:PRMT5 arginine-N-methyltransferase domain-containing protein n=1 Tax=Thalassiosira oceanica TaxID=159749 RepID=K0RMH8_THAOC|nr:hypothetical protein THAOC_33308 [Thalassiosira oceanica]|eukprot:EJK47937.1 hypothetical protein THAOC_33308 [Thalassiosira oceanica]